MKTQLLLIVLCFCSIQLFYSQEDNGVVAFNLPLRNSLTFNRFTINPTFSFVREQNKYISVSNKREWVQFNDAPLTYLASYSGRIGENIGAGIGVFQQNYGVLTTFGGILNFAYNVRLERDSNLTFGLNIGAYKSGLNTGKVITNFNDPSVENIPENFLINANPAINYGTGFFDFGITLKNIIAYNLESSMMLEEDPEKSFQGHIMYTGYINTRGFFDESKFTGLIQSEFRKDNTTLSGIAMLTVPKGIWAQVGYNNIYGVSGGLGINISPQIAIEYNFEKAIGDLTAFGSSHEISLAYRFKNTQRYEYSSGDDVSGLFSTDNKKRKKAKTTRSKTNQNVVVARKAKAEANAKAKLLAEQQAKAEADAQAKLLAEQQAKAEADEQVKPLAEQQAKAEADAQAKLLAEQRAKAETDAQAKLLAKQQAEAEANAQAKLLAEQQAKTEADAQAKLLAEQQAKAEADAQAKLLAEQQAKAEAVAQAKLLAEQQAKAEADAQAKLLAEQQAKTEADAQVKRLAEQQAKAEADAQAKLLAEQDKVETDAQTEEEIIIEPSSAIERSMLALTQQTEASKASQSQLLKRLESLVETKNQDLKDLKEENDLSEQGIAVEQKPFKSISEENKKLNAIKTDLENIITVRNEEINTLKKLYEDTSEERIILLDNVDLYYRKTIKRLELEQQEATKSKNKLDERLKNIKISTEFERRRRIKRAAFDNDDERYTQDRRTLQNLKDNSITNTTSLTLNDFDFGEKPSENIQILKNVSREESGFYLVIAIHSDIAKRDAFLTKVIQSGQADVNFFYDLNSSKYYIYYNKFDNIQAANQSLNAKGNKLYNTNMTIVKIEN
ncbi:PorP/SprF family type IX secretion system membrane protein [Lacinutrix chionoecetis]